MRMIIVGGDYFRIKFSLFHKNYNSATDMLYYKSIHIPQKTFLTTLTRYFQIKLHLLTATQDNRSPELNKLYSKILEILRYIEDRDSVCKVTFILFGGAYFSL